MAHHVDIAPDKSKMGGFPDVEVFAREPLTCPTLPPTSGVCRWKRRSRKADVLIEALQWIRQFRGKVTVIKLGGSVMGMIGR